MSTTSKRPWSEVAHIEHLEGRCGGKFWFLTLACGHFKSVRMTARPSIFPLTPLGIRCSFAPKKVRCLLCP